MSILVTGGTGYIGSHTVIELYKKGYDVVIVDNLSNSKKVVLDRIKTISGHLPTFYELDCCDKDAFRKVFENEKIEGVIHFAGLKAVGESCSIPLKYYRNNMVSTLTLVELMLEYNVNNLIFSSSATVYGTPKRVPIKESDEVGGTTNPYGTTKLYIEQILKDVQKVNPHLNICLLRYFNPIGAHESGLIGEDPNGIPNNLMPYITQVAIGKREALGVFGNDYDTIDGTGVRDYIHVVDLANGHVLALDKMKKDNGLFIYNLGTGKGTSVLEMVKAFEDANNLKINYKIMPRRDGDIATCYADPTKANIELGWKAIYSVKDACRDSWNWQSKNPNGFDE